MSSDLEVRESVQPSIAQRFTLLPLGHVTNVLPTPHVEEGFERLCATFTAAVNSHPDEYVEEVYRVAGKVLCLRIVGRSLAAVYQRAFASSTFALSAPPLAPMAVTPALTIDLWDEGVTGLAYPLRRYLANSLPFQGVRQAQFNDESGRWLWIEKAGAISWLDRKANHFVGWRAPDAYATTYARSQPLIALLPLWYQDHGIHILHAGVVARQGKGILITGGSGIGKSTTALCCLLAGFDYLGDDKVAVADVEGQRALFVAYPLFQSARILPDNLVHFPTLQPHAIHSTDPQDPKSLLFLAELFPQRLVPQASINAIALPRLSGNAETKFQRATRADTFNYMARTSLKTGFGISRARFELLTELLGSVPCYWLNLGHNLAGIPPIIDKLLAQTT